MATTDHTPGAATAATFVAQGAVFASTIVRLPELQRVFALDYSALGLVLIAPALGGLLAVPAAAALAARIGGPRTTGVAAVWWALAGLPIVHTAPRVELLVIVLVAWGAGFVATDVGANTAAVALERDTGRSVLSRMHGCFSGGALLGALAGGAAAQSAVPLGTQLVCAAVLLGWAGSLVAVTAAPHIRTARRRGLLAVAARCWPLVAIAALGLMAEGAVGDWTAVHLTDLGAGPLLAATGFAVFQIAMLVGRLTGDRVIDRLGHIATIRACALAATLIGLLGYTATALTASVVVALAATATFGLALAPIFPAVIAHGAATAPDGEQETAAAAVASGGYVGVLVGPPIIGQAAQTVGLSWAMLVLPALLVAALLLTTVAVGVRVSLTNPPTLGTAAGRGAATEVRPAAAPRVEGRRPRIGRVVSIGGVVAAWVAFGGWVLTSVPTDVAAADPTYLLLACSVTLLAAWATRTFHRRRSGARTNTPAETGRAVGRSAVIVTAGLVTVGMIAVGLLTGAGVAAVIAGGSWLPLASVAGLVTALAVLAWTHRAALRRGSGGRDDPARTPYTAIIPNAVLGRRYIPARWMYALVDRAYRQGWVDGEQGVPTRPVLAPAALDEPELAEPPSRSVAVLAGRGARVEHVEARR